MASRDVERRLNLCGEGLARFAHTDPVERYSVGARIEPSPCWSCLSPCAARINSAAQRCIEFIRRCVTAADVHQHLPEVGIPEEIWPPLSLGDLSVMSLTLAMAERGRHAPLIFVVGAGLQGFGSRRLMLRSVVRSDGFAWAPVVDSPSLNGKASSCGEGCVCEMQNRAPPKNEALAQAHSHLLRDESLQFDRVGFDRPDVGPPGWLHWIGDAFRFVAPILQWVFWIGLALVAGLILYAVAREILRMRAPLAKPAKAKIVAEAQWRPDVRAARDLLADADALAAQGLYADAAHLLLLRSVQDIEQRQPRAVPVSMTTREIAQLRALPETARPAFDLIGRMVERSLFGGAAVGAQEFAVCRQAYAAFALPESWRA